MNIDPSIVLRLRKAEGWTQEKLGHEAKLDKTTVSRVERGTHFSRRGLTAQKLSQAFRVDVKVLTGELPFPEKREKHIFGGRSSMTLNVDDAAFNALALTAVRYHVDMSQIVELAPFLFSWAAEASLHRRAKTLDVLSERITAVEALQTQMPHISSILGYSPLTEELVSEEDRSIKARDLFAAGMRDRDNGDILKHDFEESEDGPIVEFLRGLAREVPDALTFEDWSPRLAPNYRVCQAEAATLVDGDEEIADAIMRGSVALSRLPNDLRLKGKAADRLAWARQEYAAHQERLRSEFLALGVDFDALLSAKDAVVAS